MGVEIGLVLRPPALTRDQSGLRVEDQGRIKQVTVKALPDLRSNMDVTRGIGLETKSEGVGLRHVVLRRS